MARIDEASVFHLRLPMLRRVTHARAARSVADNVVVRVVLDGCEGAGECVPRDYVTGETPEGVLEALSTLDLPALEGALELDTFAGAVRAVEALRLSERMKRGQGLNLAAACALELALLDAIGRRFEVPLSAVPAALGLPAALLEGPHAVQRFSAGLDFEETLEEFRARCPVVHHVKLKLGRSAEQDVARVAAVRAAVGDQVPLSVDANMAWSLEQAVEMCERLRPFAVCWYEEPLAQGALDAYAALRKRTGARVMLDESVCRHSDGVEAIERGACDLFNIRISKVGGLIAAARLAELAHAHALGFGLGAQIGELGLLWAAGRQFMAGVKGAVSCAGARRNFEVSITAPPPWVDPKTMQMGPLGGVGLGVALVRDVAERHTVRRADYSRGRGWA
jgi:L-alanine-DL-glutamate epimerase-like enolase superfamily enzyme